MSSSEAEQILKETRNALYFMQAGGIETTVPGHLILTNIRIAFLEGSARKKGLRGIARRNLATRPVINFSIARLMGANVGIKQKQGKPKPDRSIATEMQQVLIVELNTPTGPESFTFEVEDPEAWAKAMNTFAPTRNEGMPSQIQSIPSPAPIKKEPERKSQKTKTMPIQEARVEVGDVKFCPECGKELEISARFCWECGSPQPDID